MGILFLILRMALIFLIARNFILKSVGNVGLKTYCQVERVVNTVLFRSINDSFCK